MVRLGYQSQRLREALLPNYGECEPELGPELGQFKFSDFAVCPLCFLVPAIEEAEFLGSQTESQNILELNSLECSSKPLMIEIPDYQRLSPPPLHLTNEPDDPLTAPPPLVPSHFSPVDICADHLPQDPPLHHHAPLPGVPAFGCPQGLPCMQPGAPVREGGSQGAKLAAMAEEPGAG